MPTDLLEITGTPASLVTCMMLNDGEAFDLVLDTAPLGARVALVQTAPRLFRAAVVEGLRLALGCESASDIGLIDLTYAWHWEQPGIRASLQRLHHFCTADLNATMNWLCRVLLEKDYSAPPQPHSRSIAVALRLTAECMAGHGPAAWASFLAREQVSR